MMMLMTRCSHFVFQSVDDDDEQLNLKSLSQCAGIFFACLFVEIESVLLAAVGQTVRGFELDGSHNEAMIPLQVSSKL